MAAEFSLIFQEMTTTVISSLGTDAKKVADQTTQFFSGHHDALKQIADFASKGELTEEEIKSEVEDELLVFQSEMLTAKVAEKAAIERAVNTAGKSLTKAIFAWLP
jgi:hypothetical protein